MRTIPKCLLLVFFLTGLSSTKGQAQTVSAASCNTSDVQNAINSATEGETVTIPSGTCTWTSGVTISGKGIALRGAGSGRIIAYDTGASMVSIGTGSQIWTIAGYSPGFSASSISVGETLRMFETNSDSNWMQGTVTSLVGSTLTMNISSTSGSGSTHRWLISTLPSTVIVANNSSAPLFAITEDTSFHTNWSGIKIQAGSGDAQYITLSYASGGQAILIHDCWMQNTEGSLDNIDSETSRGVVWNCSFDGSSANNNQLVTNSAIRIKIDSPASGQNAWILPSYWGAADATGQNNFYVETNDFHAWQAASDLDSNSRCVWRYNLMDSSTLATHGADTSNYGQRYFEFYDNTGNFNGYSDGSTFNIANGWVGLVRGGTFVVWGNTLPALTSSDYGTKADVQMLVMNLQRNAGPNPCWGDTHSTAGEYYYAPRQVGMGRVNGTGSTSYPPDDVNGSTDSITYVGDSEPAYIWGNSRQPLGNVEVTDYGTGNSDSCGGSPDSSANYIQLNRDYFNGSTPKPGYTPYTYPHPLTQSQSSGNLPAPPSNLAAAIQ